MNVANNQMISGSPFNLLTNGLFFSTVNQQQGLVYFLTGTNGTLETYNAKTNSFSNAYTVSDVFGAVNTGIKSSLNGNRIYIGTGQHNIFDYSLVVINSSNGNTQGTIPVSDNFESVASFGGGVAMNADASMIYLTQYRASDQQARIAFISADSTNDVYTKLALQTNLDPGYKPVQIEWKPVDPITGLPSLYVTAQLDNGTNPRLYVIDAATANVLRYFDFSGVNKIGAMAINPQASTIYVGIVDAPASIGAWNLLTGQEIAKTALPNSNMAGLHVTPDSRYVYFSLSSEVAVFDAQTLALVKQQPFALASNVLAYGDIFWLGTTQFNVNIQVTGQGVVSPAPSSQAANGQTLTFSLHPAPGYQVGATTGCSGTVAGNQLSYTTGAITANCTVQVVFEVPPVTQHTLTVNVGANGSISGLRSGSSSRNSPQTILVKDASSAIFSVIADPNYQAQVTGSCQGTFHGSIYTTAALTNDCTLNVQFVLLPPIQHTLTLQVGDNGSISGLSMLRSSSHTLLVINGEQATFTVIPNPGYQAQVTGSCAGSFNGSLYTTAALTNDCTLLVSFVLIPVSGNSISPIPTLNEWMILVLILLLGFSAIVRNHQKQ